MPRASVVVGCLLMCSFDCQLTFSSTLQVLSCGAQSFGCDLSDAFNSISQRPIQTSTTIGCRFQPRAVPAHVRPTTIKSSGHLQLAVSQLPLMHLCENAVEFGLHMVLAMLTVMSLMQTIVFLVPPDRPSYTLRRLWLTDKESVSYYDGFANEGLWPLCHEAHVRPVFRTHDWKSYQLVNKRFAEVIETELPDLSAPVFIQDYHLALVAAKLSRKLQPGLKTALFWHIPWPSPDRLRMCPWRRDLISGTSR